MLKHNQVLKDTYQIIGEIGSGGGGIIYSANHLRLGKTVAVKLIKENVKGVINGRAEADILKSLKHPGLPQVFDFVDEGGEIYTVMEYISGKTLYDIIKENGKLSPALTLKWSRRLASAVAYLHNRKNPIIHSDIKPQNIMITDEGELCLIDFNISSVFDGSYYNVGISDGYSPPEQYIAVNQTPPLHSLSEIHEGDTELLTEISETGDKSVDMTSHTTSRSIIDTSSDVYSIGAVMYSCLSGIRPARSLDTLTPLHDLVPDVPESLEYIINKAMSKEKKNRFSDGKGLLYALENIGRADKRYKNLKIRQITTYALILVLLTVSVSCIFIGREKISQEYADRHISLITKLDNMIISKDYSSFNDTLDKLTSEFPDDIHSGYYLALNAYDRGDIENAYNIAYPLVNEQDLSDKKRSALNTICAEALTTFDDPENALAFYEAAYELDPSNDKAGLDLVIALVHNGNTQRAREIAENVSKSGYGELINGEIAYYTGDMETTLSYLSQITDGITDADVNVRYHAYILSAQAYTSIYKDNDVSAVKKCITLLEKGLTDLPAEYYAQMNERLVQCYIDSAEINNDPAELGRAVKLLQEMKRTGWKDYRSEMNTAVLLDRLNSPGNAKAILLEMAEDDSYSLHFLTIYIRLAFCEVKVQNEKENNLRDYSEFVKFFHKAEEEYVRFTVNGDSDPEMERLKRTYEELEELGWIE